MNHFSKAIYIYFFFLKRVNFTTPQVQHHYQCREGTYYKESSPGKGSGFKIKDSEIEGIGVILSCTATILFCTPE